MNIFTRLSGVYRKSISIPFDDSSRIVFFSDVHRGDNSPADNFAANKEIYKAALNYYYNNGFTYIEIGDGDELWENDRFSVILRAHTDVFNLLNRFCNSGRLYMIWGNHDMVKKYKNFASRYFSKCAGSRATGNNLFAGLQVHEGILLNYRKTKNKILVVHGHQGDLFNDRLWFIGRFLSRYIWRHLEILKAKNPVSPASSEERAIIVENALKRWVRLHKTPIIAGHTHKVAFPWPGETPYFNDGCCVYKGYITGIEITDGSISLVRWTAEPEGRGISPAGRTASSGRPRAYRHVIAGPEKIRDYFYHAVEQHFTG